MKICIPTEDNNGLDSKLYDHFGSAPFFAFADTESGNLELVPNRGHDHQHGKCKPIDHIDVERTDAVVCLGMGRRAFASLEHGGVDVLITKGRTVRDVIVEARDGTLRSLTTDEACRGHGHGRRH